MADINQSNWSETDSSNNSASPNGWASGTMLPSQVEPTARMMMGAIKRFYDHINATATSGGTANAQTLTYAVAPGALVAGDVFTFKVGATLTNTGATTLNINSLGATAVKKIDGTALGGGELKAGLFATVVYDGTNFVLLNPAPGNGYATATNDNAAAGNVGEFSRSSATGVSLATGTPANITSVSLTAGDWECSGIISFNPAGTTTVTSVLAGINNVSAGLPTDPDEGFSGFNATFATGVRQRLPVGPKRFGNSGTTTIFLVAQAGFATSTMSADGVLRCRRIR